MGAIGLDQCPMQPPKPKEDGPAAMLFWSPLFLSPKAEAKIKMDAAQAFSLGSSGLTNPDTPYRVPTITRKCPALVSSKANAQASPHKSAQLESRIQVRDDALGKLIAEHSKLYQKFSWGATVSQLWPRGNLCLYQSHWHPASPLLCHFAKAGVPLVISSAPWSPELIKEQVK